MGNSIEEASRQNSLRQFRQYMIVPVITWALAGIGWGVWAIINMLLGWGILTITLSFLLSLLTINVLVNRANENGRREVREILTAFLVGYKTGVFCKPRKADEKSS